MQWGMKTSSGDCWKRFAHWPDGEAFEPWDTYPSYPGEPPSAAAQKIQDCEAAEAAGLPITRRIAIMIEDNWADIGSSLALILFPPLVLLGLGGIFRWVVTGFVPGSS
jgi:hypothetical protein